MSRVEPIAGFVLRAKRSRLLEKFVPNFEMIVKSQNRVNSKMKLLIEKQFKNFTSRVFL